MLLGKTYSYESFHSPSTDGHPNANGSSTADEEPIAGPAVSLGSGSSRSARLGRRLLNEVSSSQNSNSSGRVLAHEVDHNYLQPDRTRNTRRTLSRHQRNADELDPIALPESTPTPANVPLNSEPSSVHVNRLRSSSSSAPTTSTTTTIVQRRNYMSRITSTNVDQGAASSSASRLRAVPGRQSTTAAAEPVSELWIVIVFSGTNCNNL